MKLFNIFARASATLLAFILYDVGVYVLKPGLPDDIFEKSVHDSWRRSHHFGFTGKVPPVFHVVFRPDGTPFLVTPVNSTDFARFRLRSCTPVGILLEIEEMKVLLDVMAS